jgi:anaerobic magnesium-protoporphyrin IX monomethyl ester cyclase
MRILLIQPPVRRMLRTVVPRYVEDEAGSCPPLGLASLAGTLREAGFSDVTIIDADVEGLAPAALGERLARLRPELVGVTANSFMLLDVLDVLRTVRARLPGVTTCVGGPHATLFPQETIGWPSVDLVLTGEADHSFVQLVRALAGHGELGRVPGLWTSDGVRGPAAVPVSDLDALPLPARDLLPLRRYSSIHGEVEGMTTMLTSRGCPWDCSFCFHAFGRKVRRRSPGGVVRELEAIAALGLRDAFIFDDTFTVDRRWVLEVCEAIRRARLPLVFDVRTRVDVVDPELLQALRAAGCARISLGLEAASDVTLAALGKGTTVDQARRAVAAARGAGLTVYADFMLGSPGESRRDVLDTIDLALELDPDYAQFSATTAYPGTAMYTSMLAAGRLPDVWRRFAAAPEQGFAPPLASDRLGEEELLALLGTAYRRFYLRPRFVGRYVRKLRSPARLKAAVRAAVRVARGV